MRKIVAVMVVVALIITVCAACTKDKDDGTDFDGPGESLVSEEVLPVPGDPGESSDLEEREYSIPDDAINISDLFPEESQEDASGQASDGSASASEPAAMKKSATDKRESK